MLTAKGKYGLNALVFLAQQPEGELALVADIADAANIPKKFLNAILGELRNGGLVISRKGKGGGYRLAHRAEAIKVGDIVRILEGPLAPIPCASLTHYTPCDDCDVETCEVRHMMTHVRNAIAEVLDRTTLARMRDDDNMALPVELRLSA